VTRTQSQSQQRQQQQASSGTGVALQLQRTSLLLADQGLTEVPAEVRKPNNIGMLSASFSSPSSALHTSSSSQVVGYMCTQHLCMPHTHLFSALYALPCEPVARHQSIHPVAENQCLPSTPFHSTSDALPIGACHGAAID
jgi:hypothetical protein